MVGDHTGILGVVFLHFFPSSFLAFFLSPFSESSTSQVKVESNSIQKALRFVQLESRNGFFEWNLGFFEFNLGLLLRFHLGASAGREDGGDWYGRLWLGMRYEW